MKRSTMAAIVSVFVLCMSALVAPMAFAQVGAPVAACNAARTAYDEQITKIKDRARELGWTDAEIQRIQGVVSKAQSDGTITEAEQQTILNDPAVARIRTQLNLDDLLQLRELATRANALLRCQQDNPTPVTPSSSATTSAPRTSTTAAPTNETDTTNTAASSPSSTVILDKDGNPVQVQVRVVPNAAPETGDGSLAP